jgi:anion-transporting  ArsA/GET3 family ATPase
MLISAFERVKVRKVPVLPVLLDKRLVIVTGKGGVGKTTIAAALGMLAAESGRRTLLVEFGAQSRLPALFGRPAPAQGEQASLSDRLASLSIDPDRALLEWIQALGGRVSGRVLASSGTFQYFAAAAPGAREIVSMVQIGKLADGGSRRGRRGEPDLVILDAPATGHALGLLRSPETFGKIARVGPVVRDTRRVQELLADPERSAYLAVAQGTEMAVTETIELQQGLHAALGRELEAVVVNGLLPRRFSAPELASVEELADGFGARAGARAALAGAAARAAREVHARASFQHGQVTRLRRRGFEVVPVPFLWLAELDVVALETVAGRLRGALAPDG